MNKERMKKAKHRLSVRGEANRKLEIFARIGRIYVSHVIMIYGSSRILIIIDHMPEKKSQGMSKIQIAELGRACTRTFEHYSLLVTRESLALLALIWRYIIDYILRVNQ